MSDNRFLKEKLSMKKLLDKVNKYIPGELRKNGLRFNWYVDNKKLYSISIPSNTTAWWFLKGVLLMKIISPKYRDEINKGRFGSA